MFSEHFSCLSSILLMKKKKIDESDQAMVARAQG